MQTDAVRSSNLSISSGLTFDKMKLNQEESEFAARLKAITDAQNKSKEDAEDAKLRRVCQDMEAVFLNIMMKQMRATVPKTGMMGENTNAYEIYQSMLDTEMTKEMATAGGIGLGEMLYRQLSPAKHKITNSPIDRPFRLPGE
jgi:flagellar protein FlgJ